MDFISLLRKFTDMAHSGGEDTEFMGVRLLDDELRVTRGTLANAAEPLYVYYVRKGDERCDEMLDRLHYFIKISASGVCKTREKISILRAFCTLDDAGLIERIKPEYTKW